MRHRSAHLQRTLFEHIKTGVTAAGWVTDPVNFGTTPVIFREGASWEDLPPEQLEDNTLCVTIADEGREDLQQLGGGLYALRYSLFVDCYGETGQMAWRILEDVKPLLHENVIRVIDWSTGVQTDEQCELEVVGIEPPGRGSAGERSLEARRRWRVLTAWAEVTFSG